MHILIVDDEELTRRALSRLLRDYGHTTCWAATGAGALSLMRTEKVDVLILDINLGEGQMSGWDVAREKLLDPTIRGIPVIVLTGMSAEEVREGAIATSNALSGTTVIIGKPADVEVLMKTLEFIADKAKDPR